MEKLQRARPLPQKPKVASPDPLSDCRATLSRPLAETDFPIINRKSGLCGSCVSCFYTFSTAVDHPVHNPAGFPAIRRSTACGMLPL